MFVQYLMLACALVSAGCALYVTVRAARWRQSDDWKALESRVGTIAGGLRQVESNLATHVRTDQLAKAESRLDALERDVSRLPTREDIARLEGGIDRVESEVKAAVAGVDRIEGMLMKEALNGRRA